MTKKQAQLPAASKPLVITPQCIVTLQGEGVNQYLTLETPNRSATRRKTILTPDNIYAELLFYLQEKAGEIELERQLAEDRRNAGPRWKAQPNWKLVAKHPQVEIRQGLVEASLTKHGEITLCPTKAKELSGSKSEKSLEELGL